MPYAFKLATILAGKPSAPTIAFLIQHSVIVSCLMAICKDKRFENSSLLVTLTVLCTAFYDAVKQGNEDLLRPTPTLSLHIFRVI